MLATIVIGVVAVALVAAMASRGWRGALAALSLVLALGAALVLAGAFQAPRWMSPSARAYAAGQHVVAAMDVALIGLLAVAVGFVSGLIARRIGRDRLASPRRPQ